MKIHRKRAEALNTERGYSMLTVMWATNLVNEIKKAYRTGLPEYITSGIYTTQDAIECVKRVMMYLNIGVVITKESNHIVVKFEDPVKGFCRVTPLENRVCSNCAGTGLTKGWIFKDDCPICYGTGTLELRKREMVYVNLMTNQEEVADTSLQQKVQNMWRTFYES